MLHLLEYENNFLSWNLKENLTLSKSFSEQLSSTFAFLTLASALLASWDLLK